MSGPLVPLSDREKEERKHVLDERRYARMRARRDSPLLAQLDEILQASSKKSPDIAEAAGLQWETLRRWLLGLTEPRLFGLEMLLRYLGYVAILIPFNDVGPYGTRMRDALPMFERGVFDHQPDDPAAVLANLLRLLQTKAVMLERRYTAGRMVDEQYLTEFHKLMQDLRGVIDSMAKTKVADKWSEGVDQVEFKYGSAQGAGSEVIANPNEDKDK